GRRRNGTRHNVGFLTIDALMARNGAPALRSKLGAEAGEAELGPRSAPGRARPCQTMEIMNVSGPAVARVARYGKAAPVGTRVRGATKREWCGGAVPLVARGRRPRA